MAADSTPIPSHVGRFRVDALLGRGGMGEVYKAFDPTLQRTVALKTVRPDRGNADSLQRLIREAQACARLQHRHIVTVYEAAENDGLVYIAMEFLKGEDLSAAAQRGTLPFAEKISILVQVLEALQHAHEAGVIHRDIKPSNILRQPDGNVKLLDFGLARIEEADRLTASGIIMGTLHYASPEQLRGHKLDARTDLYSVGAVAYELICGRCAHVAEGDSMTALILKVLSDPLPPMQVRWCALFPELERIVARAMAKTPDERCRSAAEMREAFATFLVSSREAIAAAEETASFAEAAHTAVMPSAVPSAPPTLRVAEAQQSATLVSPSPPAPASQAATVGADSTAVDDSPRRSSVSAAGREGVATSGPRATRWLAVAAVLAISAGGAWFGLRRPTPLPPAPAHNDVAPAALSAGATPAAVGPAAPIAPPPDSVPATPKPGGAPGVSAATTPAIQPASPVTPAATPEPTAVTLHARQMFYAEQSGANATPNPGLRYRLIQQTAGGDVDVDLDKVFRTADKVRFTFESNVDGYLYVVQQGSSGRWTVLFPSTRINDGRNTIKKHEPYQVPSQAWFTFDANAGTEEVFVFLSVEPMAQLPGFDKPVTRPETLSAAIVGDLQQRIASRDLVFEEENDGRTVSGIPLTQATYVVNRDEVGKAVAATIHLTHGQ